MEGTIQPLPGDRIPPEPKRRDRSKKRAKDGEAKKPFELEPAPRQEPTAASKGDEAARHEAEHDDGVGMRIDVTA